MVNEVRSILTLDKDRDWKPPIVLTEATRGENIDVLMEKIEAHRAFRSWRIGAWAQALPVLYANRKGYQAGDRYAAGLVADSRLGTRKWFF